MLNPIDHYFLEKQEPIKSCLQFLREHIVNHNPNITEQWRYGMPFYCFNDKRFCYLWVHKKFHQPYIGIVDGNKINHSDLIAENRARMKILLIDPNKPIAIKKIDAIFKEVFNLYS